MAGNTGTNRMHLTPRARLTWFAHLFKACMRRHHRSLAPALGRLIPRDAVVIDVGGHAGQFAKLFAGLAPDGHVYTLEPGSYALSILRVAIRATRLRNVTVLPVGLGDAPGEMTLSLPVKPSGSYGFGIAHLAETSADGRPVIRETITVTTLDKLAAAQGLSRMDFIKADVEGWEYRMLMGAADTLERFRPSLMLEVSRPALARAGDTPEALFGHLAALGYSAFALTDDHRRFMPARAGEDNDFFFVQPAIAGLLPLA